MNNHFLLFDYLDFHGRNVMQDWADSLPMQRRDRGRLDSKVDMLERAGDKLPPGLLQSTRCKHIMELAVNGQVALRPMLCRGPGPFSMQSEFTFLCGAVERDVKYVPPDAPEKAEARRLDLLGHADKRCKHERFSK
jgi:hypothetical protein